MTGMEVIMSVFFFSGANKPSDANLPMGGLGGSFQSEHAV